MDAAGNQTPFKQTNQLLAINAGKYIEKNCPTIS
jgi:hypothetical protein